MVQARWLFPAAIDQVVGYQPVDAFAVSASLNGPDCSAGRRERLTHTQGCHSHMAMTRGYVVAAKVPELRSRDPLLTPSTVIRPSWYPIPPDQSQSVAGKARRRSISWPMIWHSVAGWS